MQRWSTFYSKAALHFPRTSIGSSYCSLNPDRPRCPQSVSRNRVRFSSVNAYLSFINAHQRLQSASNCSLHDQGRTASDDISTRELSTFDDEDDNLCPVECVKEFKTDNEFLKILDKAKDTDSLVVVDFYRTACGSCKYIEQGFSKLCKGSAVREDAVIFLKHNVIDEYDEQSEVAERLKIKAVPLFHFYKHGVLLEAFPTRDKERIFAAIGKYSSPTHEDEGSTKIYA